MTINKVNNRKYIGQHTKFNENYLGSGKILRQAINGKKIYQYADEETTILLKEFNSVQCVLEYLGLKGHSKLYKAIREGFVYKGYYWSKEKKGVETI